MNGAPNRLGKVRHLTFDESRNGVECGKGVDYFMLEI